VSLQQGKVALTITTSGLTRAAALAAIAGGTIFVAVQIGHPQLTPTSITSTNVQIRESLKVLFAALAVAGITGMYLSQVRRNGVLGLIGYLLLAAGYLSVMCTTFIGVFVMPTIVKTNPGYKRFATWQAVSSSASLCSAHTFSHAGLAYSWRSVEPSAPSFRRCPTPSTDCWPFRTESP
jgi:hypothetical protein